MTAAPLPALCSPDALPEVLTRLLRDVCGYKALVYPLPAAPARCGPLTDFRPAQTEWTTASGKNRTGYIWVDTDPLALLLNRCVVRSCQSLTSGKQERAGNFNYVYCPFMAALFAGSADPASDGAVIPAPDIPGLSIRSHQASANVFLTYDEAGRPFLLVTRLWDSCAEHPWTAWALSYLEQECACLGLGLALSLTWLSRLRDNKALLQRLGLAFFHQMPLFTPGVSLPFRRGPEPEAAKPLRADGAGTGGREFIRWQGVAERRNWFRYGGEATAILQPTTTDRLQAEPLAEWRPWDGMLVLMEMFGNVLQI